MKIQFLDTNQTITGTAGTYIVVPGFQVLHYNKPCLVKLNILDDEPLNSWVEDASAVVDNLPGAALTLPIFDNSIIDLSVIASYLATFQKDLETGTGTQAARTVTLLFTVNPNGALKRYYFRIPVMNIDAPNLLRAKEMNGTDFLNDEGTKVPVAHAFSDQVWISPIGVNTTYEYEFDDGVRLYYERQGFEVEPDGIQGARTKLEVRNNSTSELMLTKKYAPLVPSDCAITFRWLNTTGSMDYISCYNWTVTPTIRRDSLGGTVTKNEIQAIFPVNNDNLNALSRLAVSPDIQVKGLLPDDKAVRAIGSTTSGVKMTASGLNRTITLKFVY
ncbi:hypothetical protein SJC25_8 [Bacteroides phage SJC25]|nr:hypothetical protein SJC25_8 [Bacteroides phage SJC25]